MTSRQQGFRTAAPIWARSSTPRRCFGRRSDPPPTGPAARPTPGLQSAELAAERREEECSPPRSSAHAHAPRRPRWRQRARATGKRGQPLGLPVPRGGAPRALRTAHARSPRSERLGARARRRRRRAPRARARSAPARTRHEDGTFGSYLARRKGKHPSYRRARLTPPWSSPGGVWSLLPGLHGRFRPCSGPDSASGV